MKIEQAVCRYYPPMKIGQAVCRYLPAYEDRTGSVQVPTRL